jgi:predicted nucleic acid-binding protein
VLLLDNSAYAQFTSPRLPGPRLREIEEWIERDEIAVCLPFILEAGFSARNAAAHRTLLQLLRRFVQLPITGAVEAHAVQAQAELARHGLHRIDEERLLIAAVAHEHGVGVLHYDADYDVIAEKTSLDFDSVWLTERGSL